MREASGSGGGCYKKGCEGAQPGGVGLRRGASRRKAHRPFAQCRGTRLRVPTLSAPRERSHAARPTCPIAPPVTTGRRSGRGGSTEGAGARAGDGRQDTLAGRKKTKECIEAAGEGEWVCGASPRGESQQEGASALSIRARSLNSRSGRRERAPSRPRLASSSCPGGALDLGQNRESLVQSRGAALLGAGTAEREGSARARHTRRGGPFQGSFSGRGPRWARSIEEGNGPAILSPQQPPPLKARGRRGLVLCELRSHSQSRIHLPGNKNSLCRRPSPDSRGPSSSP